MNRVLSLFFILLFSTNLLFANTDKTAINSAPIYNKKLLHSERDISSKNLSEKLKNTLINSTIPFKSILIKYYRKNGFMPYFTNYFRTNNLAKELISTIKNDEALKPKTEELFDLSNIENKANLLRKNPSTKNIIEFDFLILTAYHKYMIILSNGRIEWNQFLAKLEKRKREKRVIAFWQRYRVGKNIRTLLYEASKKGDISFAINAVAPSYPKAKALEKKIKEYEKIAKNGGYTKIPKIKEIFKIGKYYPEVKFIRQRLQENSYLAKNSCQSIEYISFNRDTITINRPTSSIEINSANEHNCKELYDKKVQKAIKDFQKSHGLIVDGIVGENTRKALNIPIDENIKKMRVNLERMRWLPRRLGKEYILVNIPDFSLKFYNNKKVTLKMPVIVGDKKHPTPIFSHRLSEIVLNPYWRIPQRIVKNEIIPNILKNPNYLKDEDIKVHEDWDHKSLEFDTSNINWQSLENSEIIGDVVNSPMRFIQGPGGKNPLGRIKFLFPNQYTVYLHDTPHKELFVQKDRALSHGCIRLSKPKVLLKLICENDPKIDYCEANNILKSKDRVELDLERKIPIHLVYLTSWVDEKGVLQFRDDIYGYDKMQEELLF